MEIKLEEVSWEGTQDDTQALLDKWLVVEKEPVIKGQVLVTVVLVKASIDIEAPSDGFIGKNTDSGRREFCAWNSARTFHSVNCVKQMNTVDEFKSMRNPITT